MYFPSVSIFLRTNVFATPFFEQYLRTRVICCLQCLFVMDTLQTLNEARKWRKCIRYITRRGLKGNKKSHHSLHKPVVLLDDYSPQTIFVILVFPFQDQNRFAFVVWPLEIVQALMIQASNWVKFPRTHSH